jgi:hypothetical protein
MVVFGIRKCSETNEDRSNVGFTFFFDTFGEFHWVIIDVELHRRMFSNQEIYAQVEHLQIVLDRFHQVIVTLLKKK